MVFQALPIMGDQAVKRANVIYVMPRYETPAFELGIPLSFYRYQTPRLGFWFRLYSFTLGTDNLGMFLRTGDLDNADIYLSLRIPLRKGKCLKSRGNCLAKIFETMNLSSNFFDFLLFWMDKDRLWNGFSAFLLFTKLLNLASDKSLSLSMSNFPSAVVFVLLHRLFP
jgi:hypothetical protein